MKAYKLEVLVVDFDEVGSNGIVDVLENTKYPNYCIDPQVQDIMEADIGEWSDEHPFNQRDKCSEEFKRIFK